MSKKFDVVILGTGNAGFGVAGVCHDAGKSVAVVEGRTFGGTCPVRGCVPKKVLVAAAQVLHQIDLAKTHEITVGPPSLDWGKLIAREQTFVDGVPEMFRSSLENREIEQFEGRARFTGPNSVDVAGQTLEADKIVIATGAVPRDLGLDGAEHLIDSDDILEMTKLPASLVFIGGGVIALELGHVMARAGCKITVLEMTDRLLPRMDDDAVAQIHQESERIGIDILTGVGVSGIAQAGNRLEVTFTHDGASKTVTAERVANGAGRVADVADLDLGSAGIDHDGPNIKLDQYLASTSNPNVYVAGDAIGGGLQLSPVATYEGRLVGRNIVDGNAHVPDYSHVPANVYTVPALAAVGLTEAQAQDQGLSFEAKVNDMTDWRSAKTYAETAAWSKVLVEEGSGRLIGAHIVGHGSEEIIHLFAMAMKHGLPASELSDTVYAYPTFASDIKFMV
ncbi:MAG: NAD(P)/FAD-dependent oxidoreductase [Alphaproteobacteria bacterium]|nr:NAD(P)/FAD-dependent oxidoreductase [Alphaproteobacteria bacterium]MCZ6765150.1 NAD(P)/FAD-dependent oxidoreductase [Alphaproteobacteria bacterium]